MFKWFKRRKPSLYLDPGSAFPAPSNAPAAPSGNGTISGRGKANRTDQLLAELAAIGANPGFLSPSGNQRTREIGAKLNRRGGRRTMLSAHRAITSQLGREAARELEFAWDGIGSWAG
ncbi:hypothetical protein SAMN04489732_14423 [Amycolatopsis saalfeldensis]|uniref:Uncharacterized protein n=1 Tax=Amycolatopsis saalfeldensis TaxID=394193 RepID=A0A1H8YQ83_9PSEU|nr:hypothetical protein SAMN04489732_14423 [Amycolatopsis saalfeldensis]